MDIHVHNMGAVRCAELDYSCGALLLLNFSSRPQPTMYNALPPRKRAYFAPVILETNLAAWRGSLPSQLIGVHFFWVPAAFAGPKAVHESCAKVFWLALLWNVRPFFLTPVALAIILGDRPIIHGRSRRLCHGTWS